MKYSRRELSLLVPALAAARSSAAESTALPSKCYPFETLTLKTDPQTHNQTRPVFNGATHTGDPLELHITTLAPGQMPHPAHRHEHDEMILIKDGTLEVMISGEATKIGAGSIAYVSSNELHGWKNVGTTPAQYFVIAIGKDKG